jgi:hypothetical protein
MLYVQAVCTKLMIGGGGTIVPLLLGQPPAWLLTSTPWLTYVPVYLLLVPTTLGEYIQSTCPAIIFNLCGALVDAITRGTTICAIPAALAATRIPPTAWSTAILGGIATTSGGIIVQLMGLHEEDWRLSIPGILNGGVLNTLDFWGGSLAAVLHLTLLRRAPELNFLSDVLARIIPSDLLLRASPMGPGEMMIRDNARGVVVIFLAGLFIARVLALAMMSSKPVLGKAKQLDQADKKVLEAVLHEKLDSLPGDEGVTTRARSRAGTPKKSQRVKTS